MYRLSGLVALSGLLALGYAGVGSGAAPDLGRSHDCDSGGALCTEVLDSIGYNGSYTGHDEPSLLFYSNVPGSGNQMTYLLRLPKDPPTLPAQDGSGGTFNFQLHPAFWVGLAVCDDQSSPNPGGSGVGANIPCQPDSDANIYDSSNPNDAHFIGKHPGTAFMEMQFYPAGMGFYFTGSGSPTQWSSALNIDSLSTNANTGQLNNAACNAAAGEEYVNFAWITKSGVPVAPPSPLLATGATFTLTPDVLLYNPGDLLRVTLQDTAHGLKITITDLTSGESGFMTASATNGFAQVLFDPAGTNCDPQTHNLTRDFHPMYATSSEHTRVPWAAHSYNVAFSDEIGHFEYCNRVHFEGGSCTRDGVGDLDNGLPARAEDDIFCFDAAFNQSQGFVAIGGCAGTDFDFDGVPYKLVWPGTFTNVALDGAYHARPVQFTSPLFRDSQGESRNYSRVAFEADLPRIESNTNPPCQRHIANPADPNPGQGCVNPPKGADFYPIYTTGGDPQSCVWQLGGAHLPGTTNTFGGTSTAEYGQLLVLAYPIPGPAVTLRYNNFRNVLSLNPCLNENE